MTTKQQQAVREAREAIARLATPEPAATKRARIAIHNMQVLQQMKRDLEQQMLAAKIAVAKALDAMEAAGDPDAPWAQHWRNNLDSIE